MSSDASLAEVFLDDKVLFFDDVALVGTGLSLFELELVEVEGAFSPFVEDDDSLSDLKFLLSPGIMYVVLT